MPESPIVSRNSDPFGEKTSTGKPDAAVGNRQVYLLGILNGTLFKTAIALIGQATVLPLFIATLTDLNWLIGIGASINMVGWFLPQIFGARIIAGRRYRLPWYRLMGVFRVAAIMSVAVFTFSLGGSHRDLLLPVFIILQSCYSVAGGLAAVAFLDIVGKSVPAIPSDDIPGRGSFFGWRIFLGGLAGIAVGFLVVNPVLNNIDYPDNFALLFGLAAVMVAAGVTTFGLIREEPSPCPKQVMKLKEHLPASFGTLRSDPTFRRYFITRHLITLWYLGLPFYILFARSRYDLTPFWIGAFLAARFAGEMSFNLLWATLSDKGRNRDVLRGAMLLALVPPLVVFAELLWSIPEVVYALAFFTSGGVVSGSMLGGNNYLLEHAPPDKRPLYIGMMNGTLGLTVLSSGLGGLVVDYAGYSVLFGLVVVIALVGVVAAYRLGYAGIMLKEEVKN